MAIVVGRIKFTVNKNLRSQDNSVKDSSPSKLDTSDADGIVVIKPTEVKMNNKPSKGLKEQIETKTTVTKQQNKSNVKNEEPKPSEVLSSNAAGNDHQTFFSTCAKLIKPQQLIFGRQS